MPEQESATSLEQEIVRMKSELVRMARDRNLALRSGDEDRGRQHHLAALEAEVQHVGTLARYVKTVSPAAGRELATRQTLALQHFEQLKSAKNLIAVNRWVTAELAPLLNKSEQAAHLIATSVRAGPKHVTTPFVWPVGVEIALRDAGAGNPHGRLKRAP